MMHHGASESPLPAFVAARQGAALLGVSVTFFRQRVARSVPAIDLAPPGSRKRLPRWSVQGLLSWAESQGRAA